MGWSGLRIRIAAASRSAPCWRRPAPFQPQIRYSAGSPQSTMGCARANRKVVDCRRQNIRTARAPSRANKIAQPNITTFVTFLVPPSLSFFVSPSPVLRFSSKRQQAHVNAAHRAIAPQADKRTANRRLKLARGPRKRGSKRPNCGSRRGDLQQNAHLLALKTMKTLTEQLFTAGRGWKRRAQF